MPAHQRRPARQPAPRSAWVSQADQARWQQEASAELDAILAAHPDLPPISWTITPSGRITGQALVPGDPHGSRELFTAWQQGLELQDVRETTMSDDTSYVCARGSRGTVRLTLTAVVASRDTTGNPRPRSRRPVQAADASKPIVDATPGSPLARPSSPPDPSGPSPV
jgi:hypothetical protein